MVNSLFNWISLGLLITHGQHVCDALLQRGSFFKGLAILNKFLRVQELRMKFQMIRADFYFLNSLLVLPSSVTRQVFNSASFLLYKVSNKLLLSFFIHHWHLLTPLLRTRHLHPQLLTENANRAELLIFAKFWFPSSTNTDCKSVIDNLSLGLVIEI